MIGSIAQENSNFYVTGLKLRVTISGWCVTLQVSLLRSNLLGASHTLQEKYASCVSPK